MSILDTNITVRHLTRDNPAQQARADAYFQSLAAGAVMARLIEGVLVELVQVLESRRLYNTPRPTIQTWLTNLIHMRGVHALNPQIYLRALDLYVAHARLSFVDCLCAAYAEREPDLTVVTFDKDFDRVPTITRQEP